MVAIAAIEKLPLATPNKNTLGLSGQGGPIAPAMHKPSMATPETKHPPTIHA